MSTVSEKVPKIVHIRIYKGEGFQLSDYAVKKKKTANVWRVVCSAGNKKQATPLVPQDYGNPIFNCDMKVKVPKKQIFQPINLLVIDSFENHVGQVLLMPMKVQSPPPNANLLSPEEAENVIFDTSNLIREELEQTKKNADPRGHLYFWCFVEEYRQEGMSVKMADSLRSSHTNLSHSNTSLFSRSKQDLKDLFRRKNKLPMRRDSKQMDGMDASSLSNFGVHEHYSRQLYGSETYADSMSNLSVTHQPVVHLSRHPSDCSVILHQDYREPADGRVDSDALSLGAFQRSNILDGNSNHLMVGIPQLREIPPSPTSVSTTASSHNVSVHRSRTLGSSSDLSRNQPSHLENLIRSTSTPGEFHIFPEFGTLSKEFSVKLVGCQLSSWIRRHVISVRIHTQCLPVDECIEFLKKDAPNCNDVVDLLMPIQTQPLQCKIELETMEQGMVSSLNIFSYVPEVTIPSPGVRDNRRTGSFGRTYEVNMKPPVAPCTSRSALRSIGGSLLNLAGLATNNSSSANAKYTSKSPGHQRNQSDSWSLMSQPAYQDSSSRTNRDSSKDLHEQNYLLSKENAELLARVSLVESRISQLVDENVTLKSRLNSRDKEIEDLSECLCKLRLQLLNDGLTKYLEVT